MVSWIFAATLASNMLGIDFKSKCEYILKPIFMLGDCTCI